MAGNALPDEFRYSEKSRDLVFNLVSQGVPLLVGTIDFARSVDERGRVSAEWFNTALLIDREGRYAGRYDKRHLVMFGEYVPGWRWMPRWVSTLSPLSENFSPGTDPAVFRQIPDAPFGVLICFEDTIPSLARDSVNAGARLLVNQTNDGWFEPSRASWQHAAHGVFRSVENRVPTVRATNSGVTCSITPAGRIQDVLAASDTSPEVRFPGFKTMGVVVPGAGHAPTFYSRHGDLFGWFCAVPAGAWILFLLSARLHKRC
ncbi:MAG: apolipoprotein N-acyltransferase [Kiritimatiellia bacterium]